MNMKLYTAVGYTKVNTEWNGKRHPTVIVNEKEYILDFQEMIIWCVCNWRILSVEDVKQLYETKEREISMTATKTFEYCRELTTVYVPESYTDPLDSFCGKTVTVTKTSELN